MQWTDIIRVITKLLSNYNHPVTTLFCVLLLTQNTVLTLPLSFSTCLILPVAQGLKVHTLSMSQHLYMLFPPMTTVTRIIYLELCPQSPLPTFLTLCILLSHSGLGCVIVPSGLER